MKWLWCVLFDGTRLCGCPVSRALRERKAGA